MSFLRKFFKTIYVSVILKYESCEISIHLYSKDSRVPNKDRKTFLLLDKKLTQEAIEFINNLQESNPFMYTSTLICDSINQGAVCSCDDKIYRMMSIDKSDSKTICVNKSWSMFISKIDLNSMLNVFKPVDGIDYVFSPTSVIYFIFKREIIKKPAVFVLLLETSVTISIFGNDKLLYNTYYQLFSEMTETVMEHIDDNHNMFEDTDELDINRLRIDGSGFDDEDHSIETTLQDTNANQYTLARDIKIFEHIKSTINEFYKNTMCEHSSDFIEQIYIADANNIYTNTLKSYIKEEMGLEISIQNIDIGDTICELSKYETTS